MERTDRKQQIRDRLRVRYDKDSLRENTYERPFRVAAYHRIARADPEQVSTVALIQRSYSALVGAYENWSLVGTYIEEGNARKMLTRLVSDCVDGKIDLIITTSAGNFAHSFSKMTHAVEKLKALDPPVGIYFFSEGVYSLDDKAYQDLLRIEGCEPDGSKT